MSNLKKAIQDYAKLSVKKAQANLNKVGFAGKKRKTNNTKKLSRGLKYYLKETESGYDLEMISKEKYGIFIEKGVNGWKKKQGSQFKFKKKNLKRGVMEEYIRTSKMRLFKIVKGQKKFVPKTAANIKSAAFLMGRAIAKDGIVRTNFMSEAQKEAFDESKDNLEEAMVIDMAFEIGNKLSKQGFIVK